MATSLTLTLSLFVETKSPAQLPTPNRLWKTPLFFEDKHNSVFLGGRAQSKIADARKVVNDTTHTEGTQAMAARVLASSWAAAVRVGVRCHLSFFLSLCEKNIPRATGDAESPLKPSPLVFERSASVATSLSLSLLKSSRPLENENALLWQIRTLMRAAVSPWPPLSLCENKIPRATANSESSVGNPSFLRRQTEQRLSWGARAGQNRGRAQGRQRHDPDRGAQAKAARVLASTWAGAVRVGVRGHLSLSLSLCEKKTPRATGDAESPFEPSPLVLKTTSVRGHLSLSLSEANPARATANAESS